MKKNWFYFGLFLFLILFFALSPLKEEKDISTQTQEDKPLLSFEQISPLEAKNIMDSQKDFVILDVRTTEEFAQGHIPDAVNLDYIEIEKRAEEVLPRKEQLVLVYCRSGRRSKIAAEALVKMGYTNVKEFGGILDWPYEIVK